MPQNRISMTTTISLPPSVYRQATRMASARNMSRSELFRDALRRYALEDQDWNDLLAYGRQKAAETDVTTESDIERIVDKARSSKTTNRR